MQEQVIGEVRPPHAAELAEHPDGRSATRRRFNKALFAKASAQSAASGQVAEEAPLGAPASAPVASAGPHVEEVPSDDDEDGLEEGGLHASQVSSASDPHLQQSLAAALAPRHQPTLASLDQTREALALDRALTLQQMHENTVRAEADLEPTQLFRDEEEDVDDEDVGEI